MSLAERLGKPLVLLPSDHGGFLAANMARPATPEAFAAALRKVLDEA